MGRAKRIGMAELRELFVSIGQKNVRTVLNSGNVIFTSIRPNRQLLSRAIQEAIARSFGLSASVVVITGTELRKIVENNPLLTVAKDPAKHVVAFSTDAAGLDGARGMAAQSWTPDVLAVGRKAAYLWCAAGILDSPLSKAFARATRDAVTTRNWATVLKLHAAVSASA